MPLYLFDGLDLELYGPRSYATDARAIAAARVMFGNRASRPDAELHIEGKGASELLGKVAFRHDGLTVDWFPA